MYKNKLIYNLVHSINAALEALDAISVINKGWNSVNSRLHPTLRIRLS
jgi:hypothetical protein